MRQYNWKWHFLRESEYLQFPDDPEAILLDSDLIKNTPFRVVCRKNGCFIKLYITPPGSGLFRWIKDRFFPKARSEFDTLCELQKDYVPVVEPIAWGQAGGMASCLVTREFPESTSANNYFHTFVGEKNLESQAFFSGWCAFVRDFLRSGFDHPDFHNGNILYREKDNLFTLVDVYGIHRKFRPDTRRMAMIVREFAAYLPKAKLLHLMENCGIPKPEKFYREMYRYTARQIRKEFPRRLKQLNDNYEKFICRKGNKFQYLNGARDPIPQEDTVRMEIAPRRIQIFREMDLFLNLCNIPRLRIAAFEPPDILYVEKSADAVSQTDRDDLRERLLLCGLNPEKYFFAADKFGRAVVVPNVFNMKDF